MAKNPKLPSQNDSVRMSRNAGSSKGGSGTALPPNENPLGKTKSREHPKKSVSRGSSVAPNAAGAGMTPRGGASAKTQHGTIAATHGNTGGVSMPRKSYKG